MAMGCSAWRRLVLVTVVLIVGSTCWAAEDKSLVLDLSFDEGTGTTAADGSGNGNNGTIEDAQWIQLGKGYALKFDGTSSIVEIPNSPSLCMGDSPFTIEMWVRPDDLSKPGNLVSKGWTKEFLLVGGGGYGPRACMFLNDDWTCFRYLKRDTLKANEWTHVAFVKSQKADGVVELSCYANGENSTGDPGVTPFPTTIKPTKANVSIGGVTGHGGFFKGIIDNVRIYKRALSAEEVKADYARVHRGDLEVKPSAN